MIAADALTRALLLIAAACIAALAMPPIIQAMSWVLVVWAAMLGGI